MSSQLVSYFVRLLPVSVRVSRLVDLRRSLGAAQENVEKKLEEVKAVEVRLAGIQVKSEMMEQEMAVLMKEVREKEELYVFCSTLFHFKRFD